MSIFFISDLHLEEKKPHLTEAFKNFINSKLSPKDELFILGDFFEQWIGDDYDCLLYTSPSPRDVHLSRMPSSA